MKSYKHLSLPTHLAPRPQSQRRQSDRVAGLQPDGPESKAPGLRQGEVRLLQIRMYLVPKCGQQEFTQMELVLKGHSGM